MTCMVSHAVKSLKNPNGKHLKSFVLLSIFCCSILLSGCTKPTTTTGSTTEESTATLAHPLDPLTASEIEETVRVLKQSGKVTEASRFASIALDEPAKEEVLNFKAGGQLYRKSFSVIYE